MSTDITPLEHDDPNASRLTRRQLLVGGGALGFTAVALGRLGSGSVGAVAEQLNGPGSALATATRVTTTTTTIPAIPTVLGEGEILFPIVVGEADDCYVGDNFGVCRGDSCSRRHEGVDIGADQGLPVIAVVDGTLTKKYEDSEACGGAGHGWTLTDQINGVEYKFFHLDRHEEGLSVDDRVVAGQVIGYVGQTGTTGVCNPWDNFHLHFEYRPLDESKGTYVARDSFPLLQRDPNVTFA